MVASLVRSAADSAARFSPDRSPRSLADSPRSLARSFSPKLGGRNIFSSPLQGASPAIGVPSLLSRGCMQNSALSVACTSAGFALALRADLGEETGESDFVAVGDPASALGPIGALAPGTNLVPSRKKPPACALGPLPRSRPPPLASAVTLVASLAGSSAVEFATNLALSPSFAQAAPACSWSPSSPISSCTSLMRLVMACCCSFRLANSSAADG
mmetsp:Transcript_44160/g.106127  ORF Transcript_44160/g.106127 Transcript_44160/m.106127 type:complete len:215 (-) Transcript_44160:298-942(-)